jgi:hypothetical protein
MKPVSIGDVLLESLKRHGFDGRIREHTIWDAWGEIVGNTIAQYSQPENIKNGLLVVKVSDPIWMQQLQFMKEIIIEKTNERLKKPLVKKIYLKIGECVSEKVVTKENIEPNSWNSIELDKDCLRKVDLATSEISDPDLQESIRKLMIKEKKLKKYREIRKL